MAQAEQTNDKKKRRRDFSEVAKVNVIPFIPLKEKQRVLNVILHVRDLGSVVYNLKFCARPKKYIHIKATLLNATSLGAVRGTDFVDRKEVECSRRSGSVLNAASSYLDQVNAETALLVTLWLLLPTDTYTAPEFGQNILHCNIL